MSNDVRYVCKAYRLIVDLSEKRLVAGGVLAETSALPPTASELYLAELTFVYCSFDDWCGRCKGIPSLPHLNLNLKAIGA